MVSEMESRTGPTITYVRMRSCTIQLYEIEYYIKKILIDASVRPMTFIKCKNTILTI